MKSYRFIKENYHYTSLQIHAAINSVKVRVHSCEDVILINQINQFLRAFFEEFGLLLKNLIFYSLLITKMQFASSVRALHKFAFWDYTK